jgi:hypothetical protein
MTDIQEKGRRERIIFDLFVGTAGLPATSIESRPVPEPDILCTVDGQGSVAFELGEVVNPPFAEMTQESYALEHRFARAYAALPETERARIESRLGGPPAVLASFSDHTRPGRWARAIPAILDTLVDRAGQLVHGEEIPVWAIPKLADVMAEMDVQRSSSGHAGLYATEMTEVVDQTIALLGKKFSRAYRTSAPIELVAYYVSQPPSDRPGWRDHTAEVISQNLGSSPFRRVWLFDHFTLSIPLIVPPTDAAR